MIGKKNFHDIQFLNGKVLISLPNCKTIKSSFVIFILKVNDWSNKKKLKDAETIVGKEPIFKNKSIKLKTIRIIGNWNEGEIITDSSFFNLVLNIVSSK